MTHSLGRGTCNITFNVAKAQAAILALAAVRNREAVSNFVRKAVEEKLERDSPEAALKWRSIRDGLRGGFLMITLAVGLLSGGIDAARRTPAARGVQLTLRGNRQELEIVTL